MKKHKKAIEGLEKPSVTHDLVLRRVEPKNEPQEQMFASWKKKYNVVLTGSAGTGKTFGALYLALDEIFNAGDKRQIIIVRSPCATEDVGFMPGELAAKDAVLMAPYISIVNELFNNANAWTMLMAAGVIRFMTTAYIRGITLSNSFVIVDEMQNMNFHSLDSIITRIGQNTRVAFCGDYYQSDLKREHERAGLLKFLEILNSLKYFKVIEFTWQDICRSGIVRDYIMTKEIFEDAERNAAEQKQSSA